MGKKREPLISLMLYSLTKWSVLSPLLRFYFSGKTYGLEHVPREGPLVIVSNHASDFDPPFLAISLCRPVAFMAKEELFQVPGFGTLIRLYGAYPVKRGAARSQCHSGRVGEPGGGLGRWLIFARNSHPRRSH